MLKAICLHQPLATLVAIGAKQYETRSKRINHRGPLAICSTLKPPPGWMERRHTWPFREYLRDCPLPVGCVLCVVNVVEVMSTLTFLRTYCGDLKSKRWLPSEITFGDYGPGRYAWRLADPKKLELPVPVKGRQFIFNLPPEVEAQVTAQLE
jgi:hypothetical protein